MSNKKKETHLLSWRDSFQITFRAIKLYYNRYPKWMVAGLLNTIWTTITPFIGISLSAQIIEELAGARNKERLTLLVVATLLSAALITLIGSLIKRYQKITGVGAWYERFLMKKTLDMDFCIVDMPETHQKLSTIHQTSNGAGWGIRLATHALSNVIEAIFTILGGIVLTVTLFTHRVPEENMSLTFLNHPMFILLLIVAMLAVTYLAPALAGKAESYYATGNTRHNLGNRLFGYFGWLGYEKDLSADMRIYRQDRICDKYNRNKEATFHSKGYFAKLSWGPMGLYRAASSAVSCVFTALAYLFVCLKAWAGAFGVGMVTQYISSISKVSGGISDLISTAEDIRNNAPFIKQTFEYLDTPNVMYQGSITTEKRRDRQYEVEFKDVSFKYPGSDTYALRHVNMKFNVGERLAVVGQNGSGKTTFIKLLCRLYDPTEGVILLNGIDIRKYNYRDYLDVFSVVFQDFTLNHFTLGQNVASQTDYDKDLVESCLRKAGFGERLAELPLGLDTYLGKRFDKKGVEMSGGERQKIALARALYKDAPFIILDEPTAALDPIAEAEVYSKFNEIIEDKTAIYISHRLSSCRFCDNILVFDHGRVVQQGNHDSLVSDATGKYHELWYAQAQYYNEKASAVENETET